MSNLIIDMFDYVNNLTTIQEFFLIWHQFFMETPIYACLAVKLNVFESVPINSCVMCFVALPRFAVWSTYTKFVDREWIVNHQRFWGKQYKICIDSLVWRRKLCLNNIDFCINNLYNLTKAESALSNNSCFRHQRMRRPNDISSMCRKCRML